MTLDARPGVTPAFNTFCFSKDDAAAPNAPGTYDDSGMYCDDDEFPAVNDSIGRPEAGPLVHSHVWSIHTCVPFTRVLNSHVCSIQTPQNVFARLQPEV